MSTISSSLRLTDRFTATIEKSIGAVDKMLTAVERMNRVGKDAELGHMFNDARADIHLANRALEDFNSDLQSMPDEGIRRASGGFGGLSRAIIVANQGLQLIRQTWEGVENLMAQADVRTSADARLSLINDGLRTREELEQRVMRAANDTRSSYESTAELVARMGRQDFFKGNNDLAIQFAETINKGFIVSGASATEAKNSVIQLSQGLAAGALRGDEFNSVMENAPILADAMAKSIGITKGELRSLAEEGALSADTVVTAIMNQSAAIDEEFRTMPATFGQNMDVIGNKWSDLLDRLSQPGQAFDVVLTKVEQLITWLDTADGTVFLNNVTAAIDTAIGALTWLVELFTSGYQFVKENWSNIEPILWGIGIAVGALGTAYLVYKGIMIPLVAIQKALSAAETIAAGATFAQTAAQHGLNAALFACPITWIVLAVVALIAIIIAVTLKIMDLWKTNVDFKVGVIGIWNSILGFFDQVPIFFASVAYGIADAFSWAKVTTLNILDSLVNGAIDKINWLIDVVNRIPGVSIGAIDHVTFGAETAIEEEAKRQQRAANLAEMRASAAEKSAERANALAEDGARWRAEAEAAKADEAASSGDPTHQERMWENKIVPIGDVKVKGGKLDSAGKVDISNQSLEYLRDIAEMQALRQFEALDAYVTLGYEESQARLSKGDSDLLMNAAGRGTNIYYLQYNGRMDMKNDIKQGEDWESVKQRIKEETAQEIETGLSDLEAVFA